MRRHDMNRRRFMLALLVTLILVTYLGRAQAQSSYNTYLATAQDRLFKLDLWDSLDVFDVDCTAEPAAPGSLVPPPGCWHV